MASSLNRKANRLDSLKKWICTTGREEGGETVGGASSHVRERGRILPSLMWHHVRTPHPPAAEMRSWKLRFLIPESAVSFLEAVRKAF